MKGFVILEYYEQQRKSLMKSVKIDHEEVLRIVLNDLIEKRNAPTNKIKDSFDAVLRYYISEDEFKRHVIDGEPIS